jgi:hypothetical protein
VSQSYSIYFLLYFRLSLSLSLSLSLLSCGLKSLLFKLSGLHIHIRDFEGYLRNPRPPPPLCTRLIQFAFSLQAGKVNVTSSTSSTKKDEKSSSDKSATKESVEKTTKEEEEVNKLTQFLTHF